MRRYQVLTGPTAAGKTAWLAARGNGRSLQVVSADSRQVYQYMDIGTGKPAQSILDTVTHHCLSVVTPGTEFSVFHWIPLAVRAMEAADAAGAEVWVSGGTGLYIRVLVQRLELGAPPRPALRSALAELMKLRGPKEVAADLGLTLREMANPVRVLRAAEQACSDPRTAEQIYLRAGLPGPEALEEDSVALTEFRSALRRLQNWRCAGVWVLDPGRVAMEERITARVIEMFQSGLVEEVRDLQKRGYGEAGCVARGIAYKEAAALLSGSLTEAEAIDLAIVRTRQYAKRQCTYFRSQRWDSLPDALAENPAGELP